VSLGEVVMRTFTDWKLKVSMVMMLVACFGFTGSMFSDAGSEEPKLISFSGEITKISKDHLIVSGKEVILVDVVHDGIRYKTRVFDAEENPMELSRLKVGNWVRVLGTETTGGSMYASSIYFLLPPEPH
jgi:hypothetical protein